MSIWISVYNRRPLGNLTADSLLAGITGEDPAHLAGIDYLTLAEDYDLPPGVESDCSDQLRVESHGADRWAVAVPGSEAPVLVLRWGDPARVSEELDEVRDRLSGAAQWTPGVVEVTGIELKPSHLHTMAIVVAYEIARYLGQLGNGVIVDDLGAVQNVRNGAFEPGP